MPPQYDLFDVRLVSAFPNLHQSEQREGINLLKSKCFQIENAGSLEEQMVKIGHKEKRILPDDERRALVAKGLDTGYWQLAKLLRYSTPTRIAEATPYIRRVLDYSAAQSPGKLDVVPVLYLGVALHKVPGEEKAALSAFKTALAHGVDISSTNTMLWARGCMSRLLRRMGLLKAAEKQEWFLRNWFRWHKFVMPLNAFTKLVLDPDHMDKDFIMEHPEMQQLCEDANIQESGSDSGMHFG